jgi:Uma2 family endonuclease
MTTLPHEVAMEIRTNVSWEEYAHARNSPENAHLRITYHDGKMLVKSPEYLHEIGAERLNTILREIFDAFDLEFAPIRTTTLRRRSDWPRKGSGKEPDLGYYIGASESIVRMRRDLDLDVNPPPDLVIEVDNKADSELALPVYAALSVREVWRYDARFGTAWFGRLEDNTYHAIDRSVVLPMLTPRLVEEAIAQLASGLSHKNWSRWVRNWTQELARSFGSGEFSQA